MHLPRMTRQTRLVIAVMLGDIDGSYYGRGLSEATGLSTGTIHPVLGRLQAAGVLESWWEDGDVADMERRPRRHYFRMTPAGSASLRNALAKASPTCRCPNCKPIRNAEGPR